MGKGKDSKKDKSEQSEKEDLYDPLGHFASQRDYIDSKKEQLNADKWRKDNKALMDNGLNRIWKIKEYTDRGDNFLQIRGTNCGRYIVESPLSSPNSSFFLLSVDYIEGKKLGLPVDHIGVIHAYGFNMDMDLPKPGLFDFKKAYIYPSPVIVLSFGVDGDRLFEIDQKITIPLLKQVVNGHVLLNPNDLYTMSAFMNFLCTEGGLYPKEHYKSIKALGVDKFFKLSDKP